MSFHISGRVAPMPTIYLHHLHVTFAAAAVVGFVWTPICIDEWLAAHPLEVAFKTHFTKPNPRGFRWCRPEN